MKKIIYVLIIFIFVFCCIELFCRIFKIGQIYTDERNSLYEYNEVLGWFPIVNKKTISSISTNEIKYFNNSLGFRDIEHNYNEKDKKRIMFLGDSFCFGYRVKQDKIFVELLREKLKYCEIFNCGVSGYSTDQEFLLLQEYFDIIKPDIVFLLVCMENDIQESQYNMVYEYYKPYFTQDNNVFTLKGIPVPKTWLYYKNNFFIKRSNFICFLLKTYILIKNPVIFTNNTRTIFNIMSAMKNFLKNNDCDLIIGLTKNNKAVERGFSDNNIKYIVLENSNIIENDMHWNEKGHKFVSDKIYEFFKQKNIIE